MTPYRRWQNDPDHVDASGLTGREVLQAVTRPLKPASVVRLCDAGNNGGGKPKAGHPVVKERKALTRGTAKGNRKGVDHA